MLEVLYEDKDIIAVIKPYGVASQMERGSGEDMVSILMNYFHRNKEPYPYVGVVHRLDKNVAGVMVYGKSKASTAKLNEQIAKRSATKKYMAAYIKGTELESGLMKDVLIRDGRTNTSRVANKNEQADREAKSAELTYTVMKAADETLGIGFADITLITGRHHQIRVQFASRGVPLVGDRKYAAKENEDLEKRLTPVQRALFNMRNIGLYCYSMEIIHPTTKKTMVFENLPNEKIFSMVKR